MAQQLLPATLQTAPAQPTGAALIKTYGVFVLSVLAMVLIALAWLLHDLDEQTALAAIGMILGANGLVSATQWQAAPGLIGDLQTIIAQLTSHIVTLHQQIAAPAEQPTAKIAVTKLPQSMTTASQAAQPGG